MRTLLFLILLLPFLSWAQTTWTEKYLKLVNDYRASINIKPLVYSEEIEIVARKHSLDMALKVVPFGHEGFSERCEMLRKIFELSNLCGEILAWGHDGPRDVFDGWMNSPKHRIKIENPRYTHTGLGFAISEEGHIFWTQNFLEVKPLKKSRKGEKVHATF